MTGRHAATPWALTEPMKAVRPVTPPIDPEPETSSMPRLTVADIEEWDRRRSAMTAEEWMEPLRTGGNRTEHRMRATMRERGLLLVNRVSRRARRLRQALARGGR